MPETIDIQVQVQDREGNWHVACHCGATPAVAVAEESHWRKLGYPTRIETVRETARTEVASNGRA